MLEKQRTAEIDQSLCKIKQQTRSSEYYTISFVDQWFSLDQLVKLHQTFGQ